MRRRAGFSAHADDLVKRVTMRKLRVQLLAEFAWAAGSKFVSLMFNWIDVFHDVGWLRILGVNQSLLARDES
jgi:hypothetical protein